MYDKLSWTPGRFSNEERIMSAEKILLELKNKYKVDLLAVTVEGSTAKNLDKPYSDLEMTAIMADDFKHERWYAFIYNGLFVGIGYDRLGTVIESIKNVNYEWCVAGDRFLTAKFIYDPTNLAERIRKYTEEIINSTNFMDLAKEAFADMYENVLKLITIDDEDIMSAAQSARGIAYWATMTVGLINKKRFLSSRMIYSQAKQLEQIPDRYSECIEELFSLDTNITSLRDYSAYLWNDMVYWLKQFGISLDDDRLGGI
jgi:kanamycin nucleotidyltransferase